MTTVVNIRTDRDKCDVYIGRNHHLKDRHYGNPFVIGKDGNREEVIEKFREWLEGSRILYGEQNRRKFILSNLPNLKGKRLGCFCAPRACHGDVLAEMADK